MDFILRKEGLSLLFFIDQENQEHYPNYETIKDNKFTFLSLPLF